MSNPMRITHACLPWTPLSLLLSIKASQTYPFPNNNDNMTKPITYRYKIHFIYLLHKTPIRHRHSLFEILQEIYRS